MNTWSDAQQLIQRQPALFVGVFAGVLSMSYLFLLIIDFVPEPPAEAGVLSEEQSVDDNRVVADTRDNNTIDGNQSVADEVNTAAPAVNTVASAVPIKMVIDRLERTVPIMNPTSRAISDLDEALLSGAVRHPDSADFTQEGNIFVLGHSSYLPNVRNRNYQAFNGIDKLEWGDTIRLYSEDTEYIYRVERVYEAKATELVVPIANTGPKLTLATCDSFGSIDDRFIVEATLQSARAL